MTDPDRDAWTAGYMLGMEVGANRAAAACPTCARRYNEGFDAGYDVRRREECDRVAVSLRESIEQAAARGWVSL